MTPKVTKQRIPVLSVAHAQYSMLRYAKVTPMIMYVESCHTSAQDKGGGGGGT